MKLKLLKAVWVGRLLEAGTEVGDDCEKGVKDFLLGLPQTIVQVVEGDVSFPAQPAESFEPWPRGRKRGRGNRK